MIRFFKNDIFSEKGNPIKILYSPIVNDDGTITLVESGKENLDEYIASFKDSVDISVLIQRFVNGDMSALEKVRGSYGDYSDVPNSYAEFLQMQIDAERNFNALPVSIKEKFNNNVNEFIMSAGSKEWFNKVGVEIKNGKEEVEKKDE